MLQRATIVAVSLLFASAVLLTSILRTTQPNYAFSQSANGNSGGAFVAEVDYYLPYPGVLPDHFLWPFKAFRDRVWLFVTRDSMKRAELLLLFADKRVGMAEVLIKGGKAEIGVATAQKAEKYLEDALEAQDGARLKGVDTTSFLTKLATASLKHREVLESTLSSLPEDAVPVLTEVLSTPKGVYEKSVHKLNEKGRPIPGGGEDEEGGDGQTDKVVEDELE